MRSKNYLPGLKKTVAKNTADRTKTRATIQPASKCLRVPSLFRCWVRKVEKAYENKEQNIWYRWEI